MMKLTDLNIDCLENILEYLKVGDLLSAASSSKRLNKAANFIFVRKPWQKHVKFTKIHLSRNRLIEFEQNCIEISDLKTSFQFIRCFGHLIPHIEFVFSNQNQSEIDQHVINYISQYCSDSLTKITIENSLKGWEHLNKPFPKVKEVILYECDVSDTKNSIKRLFPKMENLRWCGTEKPFLVDPNHYSNLEVLYILDNAHYSSKLCVETLANILCLNPQLKHIYIHTLEPLLDCISFQNAMKTLQNLLNLTFNVKKLSTKSIDSVISLNSLTSFTIYIDNDDIMGIPFTFGQLEYLNMSFSHNLNADFFSFIDKHPTLVSLQITVDSISFMDLTKIAKSLPSLGSIFFMCKISANEAINFMSNFQDLIIVSFFLNETDAYDDFRACVSNEWECEIFLNRMVHLFKKPIVYPEAKRFKLDFGDQINNIDDNNTN